jgi:predicted small lipoprotein YifL
MRWPSKGARRAPVAAFTVSAATALLVVLPTLAGCGGPRGGVPPSEAQAPVEWFTDETEAAGLAFVHFNGMSGEFYFPEHLAPGAGLLDYDGDGDLDVFLVQGRMIGTGKTLKDALVPPRQAQLPLKSRLFRNDLKVHDDGTRSLKFTDVTRESGIDASGYGMGVAAGDFTNDGCVDIYVTNFGPNQMFRNNCDGTFTDVSRETGVDDPGFSVSAAFLDYDRDGWLDLFVGNYVPYSVDANPACRGLIGGRDYCSPRVFRAQPDRLYRNQRGRGFVDVTARALRGGRFGPALGVVAADYDADGWVDLFVANDGESNQLWMNQRDGTFEDRAGLAGVAFNVDGKAVAGMGVDAGDFDNDGDEDVFLTTLTTEANTLFINGGNGLFEDRSARSGLGGASLPYTGWGTGWIDVDNDGWLDLLTVNGTIQAQEGRTGNPFPYDQRKQLFHNLGNGRFNEVSSRSGVAFQISEVGRGAAFGDIDNDGAVDVVIANDNGPARLLLNRQGRRNHWLGLRLLGGMDTPRDMLGVRVAIMRNAGSTLWRRARSDGSYASANDPRVLAGLGGSTETPRVRVLWPSGHVEEWSEVPIDRWTTLRQGGGQTVEGAGR